MYDDYDLDYTLSYDYMYDSDDIFPVSNNIDLENLDEEYSRDTCNYQELSYRHYA